MTTETILAVATQRVRLPDGYTLKLEAKAYQLGGNAHPHFSVTGEMRHHGKIIEDIISTEQPGMPPLPHQWADLLKRHTFMALNKVSNPNADTKQVFPKGRW